MWLLPEATPLHCQRCQQRWQQGAAQRRDAHTGCLACARSINTQNQSRARPAAAPASRSWGGQRRGEGALSLRTELWTHVHTHPLARAGRTPLTCFQLEVVRRKGLPRQGQGRHRLEMWHVLLDVCGGVADAVRKKPFNYSSWYKNQSPPCNIVTNCYIIWLLQDFNLKHRGKHFCSFAVQSLFDGTSHTAPLQSFYPVIP